MVGALADPRAARAGALALSRNRATWRGLCRRGTLASMAGEGSKGVKRHARKLLVASLGVAAVSYVQCGGDTSTTGVKHDAGTAPDGTAMDRPYHTLAYDFVLNPTKPSAQQS